MTVKDPNRWEETDNPGEYRRRLNAPDEPKPDTPQPKQTNTEDEFPPGFKWSDEEQRPVSKPPTPAKKIDFGFNVPATAGAIKTAAEHGIDLHTITGTGKDGRITKADVEAAL